MKLPVPEFGLTGRPLEEAIPAMTRFVGCGEAYPDQPGKFRRLTDGEPLFAERISSAGR
jgi:hypothetical protein